ncbi:hypothetical protein [Falsirhodobacter algicola]|uniref:Uncharacterized protein n=1 Tax=Falsirhodobacter algicola TaxID=2692330 RepID=A0A8J8MRM4_9RHOB|nr:hypothetical protein [Falsirhodobacter algicola]QUS35259.1 hypothetical protein GR316_02595 [Falsirhodobacter algicola]
MAKTPDPQKEAETVRDERAKAATSEKEKRAIAEQEIDPLLNEPGRGTKEWD